MYWIKKAGFTIMVNKYIDDGSFYKTDDCIICDSNTAYAVCFADGVNDESIKAAISIARQVLEIES